MLVEGQLRFEALLNGGSGELYNQPLLEHEHWLVAPTLGAVTPGWLLVMPRCPALSYRDWEASGGQSAIAVLASVLEHLGLQMDEIIWFEHGPASPGTVVGCGLDHAHLHILIRPPFSFDVFVEQIKGASALGWTNLPSTLSYSSFQNASSYLIAGSGGRAIRSMDVETAVSQFFRRIVAMLVGKGLEWDYRASPHTSNISRTIDEFKHLECEARRGS